MAFYGGILGFKEFWRGSSSPRMLSWVNIRPAEGQDYIELMLYNALPAPNARGTQEPCVADGARRGKGAGGIEEPRRARLVHAARGQADRDPGWG